MNTNFIMKPKNDYVFKKIFGDEKNKDILISFLESTLNRKISDVRIQNGELTKENISDKKSILDIRATIDEKIEAEIEIQLSRTIYMPARSLYYWSKIYCEQLKIGDEYRKLKKTICINIVDFEVTESKKYHSVYRLKELEEEFELTDKMEIHFIEIPKLKGYLKEDNLSQWIKFINSSSESEMRNMAVLNENIDKALEILMRMSQSDEERAAYLSREMALHDEATKLEEAREEGIEHGREQGIEQTKIENARNLFDVLDDEAISKRIKLDLDRVKKLREEWEREQSDN